MTPFAWFGAAVAVVVALAALAVAVSVAADSIGKLWDRWERRHEELVIRRAGSRLAQECHWLSESDAAMDLLQALATAMRNSGTWDINTVRERWRELQAGER